MFITEITAILVRACMLVCISSKFLQLHLNMCLLCFFLCLQCILECITLIGPSCNSEVKLGIIDDGHLNYLKNKCTESELKNLSQTAQMAGKMLVWSMF